MCRSSAIRLFATLAAAVSIFSSGCQCCHFTECYADIIDDVSDHKIVLDGLYNPATDLNRIGKPDWCACPLNRAICNCGRCRLNHSENATNSGAN